MTGALTPSPLDGPYHPIQVHPKPAHPPRTQCQCMHALADNTLAQSRDDSQTPPRVAPFVRYTQILAPGLDVLGDERLAMNRPPMGDGMEAAAVEVEVLPPV